MKAAGQRVQKKMPPQILRHGGLARDHGPLVIFLDDGVDLTQLLGSLIRSGLTAGVEHHHLPAALLEHIPDLLGNEEIRDAGAEERMVGDHARDTGDLVQTILHLAHIGGGEIVA